MKGDKLVKSNSLNAQFTFSVLEIIGLLLDMGIVRVGFCNVSFPFRPALFSSIVPLEFEIIILEGAEEIAVVVVVVDL